ncbi:1-aminocyclopropane-1-carboxylate oxidase-like isoform X2 [Dendrobium catenatum]|uniref:1-aminocyclopropane-1-carboxylate oxidase-like isoform X2 n=1 Tax=Dendrobium catenatum TaxID=906689 RepID=UPI0009F67720|nr:1-aminocyclopropane-1-carboxylate oxidase-like isoform X2 [Dendrobium catenatum]
MAVPVIDLSKLQGSERAATMAEIGSACEEWGFFQLVNHDIPLDLLDRVKKVCSECYKMEREEGFKDSKAVQLLNDLIDSGEACKTLDDLDWEDVFILQDDNQWPSNPLQFKETMKEYRLELKKLAEKMLNILEDNLGLSQGYIKQTFSGNGSHNPFFGTKVSHYPPCPRPDRVGGLRNHTDAGGLILLFQDDKVGGLQVLKNGQWFDVQPLANTIVINIGDQIEVISNGRYKSALHRVLASANGNRRSIASFYNPALEAVIEPAVMSGGGKIEKAGYPRFVFGDYMEVYAKQKFMDKEQRFQSVGIN